MAYSDFAQMPKNAFLTQIISCEIALLYKKIGGVFVRSCLYDEKKPGDSLTLSEFLWIPPGSEFG